MSPLETDADQDRPRRRPDYCTRPATTCDECSLVNYGRDCHNVPLDDRGADKYLS
jgi:hypothetical protein